MQPFFRLVLQIFALANPPGFLSAQNLTVNWEPPLFVSPSSFSNGGPRLELLPGGKPAVLWGQGGATKHIWFSKLENGAFTVPVQIPKPAGVEPDLYDFGGMDLAVRGDTLFASFENFSRGIFLARSDDGGTTWQPPVPVFDPPAGVWATLSAVGIDKNGQPLVGFIREKTDETDASQVLCRSNDGGQTFLPPVAVSTPADGDFVCECCPPHFLTAGDTVWYAFRNNFNNRRDMWASRSLDGGQTFDRAADIDNTDWTVNVCPISGPKLLNTGGGQLLSAWMSKASGQSRVYVSALDGGAMQPGGQQILPITGLATANQNHPDIAGSGDTLGLAWEENGFGANGQDILFSFSENGAAGLTGKIVNLSSAPGTQRYPVLAFADGVFHLVYADVPAGRLVYRRGKIALATAVPEAIAPEPDIDAAYDSTAGTLRLHLYHMHTGGRLRLQLFDPAGRLVRAWDDPEISPGDSSIEISTGRLAPGMYFLQFQGVKMARLVPVFVAK